MAAVVPGCELRMGLVTALVARSEEPVAQCPAGLRAVVTWPAGRRVVLAFSSPLLAKYFRLS